MKPNQRGKVMEYVNRIGNKYHISENDVNLCGVKHEQENLSNERIPVKVGAYKDIYEYQKDYSGKVHRIIVPSWLFCKKCVNISYKKRVSKLKIKIQTKEKR